MFPNAHGDETLHLTYAEKIAARDRLKSSVAAFSTMLNEVEEDIARTPGADPTPVQSAVSFRTIRANADGDARHPGVGVSLRDGRIEEDIGLTLDGARALAARLLFLADNPTT